MARMIPENPIEFPDLYPKQKEFVRSNKTFVCYGGARGGGIVTGKQIGRAHV